MSTKTLNARLCRFSVFSSIIICKQIQVFTGDPKSSTEHLHELLVFSPVLSGVIMRLFR